MIRIIHGGQTGVDRGAHEGAIAVNWNIVGYMPKGCRDEFGPIPHAVAEHLLEHHQRGYIPRTMANVKMCDALLVVVPDANDPRVTPGTAQTLEIAMTESKPRLVVEPSTTAYEIAAWLKLQHGRRPLGLGLMVAGPRESKWTSGRAATAALIRRVAAELSVKP